jgi:hypothetical protein
VWIVTNSHIGNRVYEHRAQATPSPGREPDSKAAAADWCARQLDEVADLPPPSNVRVLVEQFVEDIKGSFRVSQAAIGAERQ